VSAAGVYTIGEVFDGNPAYLQGYASLMPGLLNYATYYPANNFYQQKGSAQALVDMLDTVNSGFPDPAALGTFVDNHDNPRWLNQKNDVPLLKNALAFVTLSRGIPIVYYGTEQEYAGGADPTNREDLWRSNFNTQSDLYQTISKLLGAKKSASGLAENDLVNLYVTDIAYAWSRAGGNLIVLTTNTGKGTTGNYCFSTRKANGKWTSVLGGNAVSADGSGNVCVDVKNGEPVVLITEANAEAPIATASPTKTVPSSTLATSTVVCPTTVSVTFNHQVATTYGENIKIAGNTNLLGNWDSLTAPALSSAKYTASNPLWSVTLKLPAGQQVQYKFIRVANGGAVTWEGGDNRIYGVPACASSASVDSDWR
jgi:alpha-amylase